MERILLPIREKLIKLNWPRSVRVSPKLFWHIVGMIPPDQRYVSAKKEDSHTNYEFLFWLTKFYCHVDGDRPDELTLSDDLEPFVQGTDPAILSAPTVVEPV